MAEPVPVLVDAQVGTARVMRPMNGFEAVYQGVQAATTPVNAAVPIPFFEWSDRAPPNPRDDNAGKPGFDPNLMRFMRVPLGCQVLIWFPVIFTPGSPVAYSYTIVWRMNNLGRYQLSGLDGPYHNPFDAPGQPDTAAPDVGPRLIIPAAVESIVEHVAVPTTPIFLPMRNNLRTEYIQVRNVPPVVPLLAPGVRGVYQQGVLDPTLFGEQALAPIFQPHQTQSKGDEMMIIVDRGAVDAGDPNEDWNFGPGAIDAGFSNLYGTAALSGAPHPNFPELGIYVYCGAIP